MLKTDRFIENKELTITVNNIEANAELKLAKADRAKMQWPSIALLKVVGSIHDTIEKYAVRQPPCFGAGRGLKSLPGFKACRRVIESFSIFPIARRISSGLGAMKSIELGELGDRQQYRHVQAKDTL